MPWLDLFRGLAVVFMIEAHVLNTFQADGLRAGEGFARLNYLNGLVAPAFLWIAGYLHGLGMRRSGRHPGRTLRRLAGVATLGYALHLPVTQLRAGQWAEALRIGSQVDVLQCLAFSLALLVCVQCWLGRLRMAALVAGLVLFVGAAEAVKSWQGAPVPLLAFVNATTGSLFPLWPWAGFVFAGALSGSWAARGGTAFSAAHALWPVALSLAVYGAIPEPEVFSEQSASFFFERLSWVTALAWACQWLPKGWAPYWILLAGRRSLLLYAAHLILLGWLGAAGLRDLGYPGVFWAWIGVLGSVGGLAWARERWSARTPQSA
jgi:uncharacterized membrane protein